MCADTPLVRRVRCVAAQPILGVPRMSLLEQQPRLVTVGAQMFADAVAAQAAPVQQLDWRPPLGAEGVEADLARILADPRHADANQTAVARMLAAGAELVDVRPASEALALGKGSFLHAGPPIGWDRASGPLRGALIGAMVYERLAA